eukprot:scaffold799_cov18-Tisochrysis_lutea.AAC.3
MSAVGAFSAGKTPTADINASILRKTRNKGDLPPHVNVPTACSPLDLRYDCKPLTASPVTESLLSLQA